MQNLHRMLSVSTDMNIVLISGKAQNYTVSPLLTARVRSAQKYPVMRGNWISERCSKCTRTHDMHDMFVAH